MNVLNYDLPQDLMKIYFHKMHGILINDIYIRTRSKDKRLWFMGRELHQPGNNYLYGKSKVKFYERMHEFLYKSYGGRHFPISDIMTMRCVECTKLLKGRQLRYCSNTCSDIFYSKWYWDSIRFYILSESPKCNICKINDSEEVDHIKELATAIDTYAEAKLFNDRENLQALCQKCHKQKTKIFLGWYFKKPKTEKVVPPGNVSHSKQLSSFII